MNVLYLSPWFPHPADNGAKIRVAQLIRALASRFDVTLMSYVFGTARPRDAFELEELCQQVITIDFDPFDRGFIRNASRFFSRTPIVDLPNPTMERLVREAARSEAFEVVIFSTLAMAGYLTGLKDTSTRILEEHNSSSKLMEERYVKHKNDLLNIRYKASWQKAIAYERRMISQFDLCTMVSNVDRDQTIGLLDGKSTRVEVVPNGVDCESNRPGISDKRPSTLIFNGSLTYDSNYEAMEFFFDCIYPLIKRDNESLDMIITGAIDGVSLEGLRVDESVNFTGNLPDIRRLVSSATICVVPILTGGGTRLKILEAMALGTPVIATGKAVEGLEVRDGLHIIIANDPYDFAHETISLLQDPNRQQYLAENARKLVTDIYDWVEIGRQFVELIESTIVEKRSEVTKPGPT